MTITYRHNNTSFFFSFFFPVLRKGMEKKIIIRNPMQLNTRVAKIRGGEKGSKCAKAKK